VSSDTTEPGTDRRPAGRTVFPAVGVVLGLISVALWVPVLVNPRPVPFEHPPLYAWALLVAAFVVCELFPLRVEVRRETLLVSLSELPLVIGVLLLPPWVVGVVYLSSGLVVYLARRDNWGNNLMNLSLIAVESGVAVLAVSVAGIVTPAGDMVAAGQRFWPVAVGVLIGAFVSALAVGLAYRIIGQAEPLVRVVLRSMLSAAIIVGLALAGFTVWNAPMGGPILCVGLLLVLGLLYRNYSTFLRQHADLAGMYEFGSSVTAAGGDVDEWLGLMEQVRDQLNAQVAVLYLTEATPGPRTLAVGADGPLTVPFPPSDDPLMTAASEAGGTMAASDRTSDAGMLAALAARGAWDVIVVPLRSGDRDRGYVEVRDRRSRWGRFSEDDLRLLQTLGGHLATALDNHRLVERLRHDAYHDSVTGLRNRLGLQISAEEMTRAGRYGGVLLLELNVLGDVNSALGHDRGEQLLAAVGERLTAVAGPDRPVGRIETDRFAVLLEPQPEDAAAELAGKILQAVRRAFSVDGIEVEPQAVAGVAMREADGADAGSRDTLLQRAELAVLSAQAKDEQLAVYRTAMGEVYRRRFQLVTQFRRAVESGRVTLHYQPKLTLAERELTGVEALVRWMHPEYGFVSPAELIEAIETTGSIDILFSYVLEQALSQIDAWLAEGLRIGVAVNLSVRNLLAPDFTRTVSEALSRHATPTGLLTLEITESSVMARPERSLTVLRELHAMGIQLSVDDFGTGYSSLAYLRRLPIDEIKIDKSFVQGMVTDLGDMAIVRSIIDLGHSLGLRVVAEGVEEEAARDALRSMRCDTVQGFLLSRPLPLDRFEAWLASRTVPVEKSAATRPTVLRIRT
jgi:diguanylate cyclase (GGDEF)-like protein